MACCNLPLCINYIIYYYFGVTTSVYHYSKTIVYAYDAGGNILSKTEYPYTTSTELSTATNTVNYTYGDSTWKDKLTSYNGNAITYDASGNTLTYNGYMFTWEAGRQLSAISGNGQTISYKYNDSGYRTEKTVNGVTTKYYLNSDNVVLENTGSDNIYYSYDADDKLVSMTLNCMEYFYIRNGQGDITGLIDTSGTQVVSYVYDSWGKLVSIDGSLKDTVGLQNPYRYRGYRYDTETGLYYLQSRYYNPEMGRYINADSQFNPGLLGSNLFAYCYNNPIMNSDPTGYSTNNRKPGKTPPSSWPKLPSNLAGKKTKWNPKGYWEGANGGKYTWDSKSHGAGVDRGNGQQDGHWDDENSDNRWDRNGKPLPGGTGSSFSSINNSISAVTGLTGIVLITYIIISKGRRYFLQGI